MRKTPDVDAGHALKSGTVFLPCLLCRAPVDLTTPAGRGGLPLCDRHEDMRHIAAAIDSARVELWTIIPHGAPCALDFYLSREAAETALEDARGRAARPAVRAGRRREGGRPSLAGLL